jgi:hypothetical protein
MDWSNSGKFWKILRHAVSKLDKTKIGPEAILCRGSHIYSLVNSLNPHSIIPIENQRSALPLSKKV